MEQESKNKGGRPIGTASLRARASRKSDMALETLTEVAADATADPAARVDAAKAILGFATASIR